MPDCISVYFNLFSHVCKIAKSDYISLSVCPSTWNNLAATGWIFMIFDIWIILKICQKKIQVSLNLTRITGTLHEDQNTFLIISCTILIRMRDVADKSCRENQTQNLCSVISPPGKSCRLWGNVEKNTCGLWHMRIACWIPKATNTHTDVIFIAFPLWQCLHKRASMLRYTYIACLALRICMKRRYRIQEVKLCLCSYITPCRHVMGV